LKPDGSTVLQAYNYDGTLQPGTEKIDFETFLDTYKITKEAPIEMLKKSEPVINSNDYKYMTFKSYISIAIVRLASQFPDPDVSRIVKPKKGVFCNKSFSKGSLTLFPFTNRISVVLAKDKHAVWACGCSDEIIKDHVAVLVPMPAKDDVSAAWLVRFTDDENDANIKVKTETVYVNSILGTCTRKTKIDIPTFTNTVNVKKGDELVLFYDHERAPTKSANKTAEIRFVNVEPPAKKART